MAKYKFALASCAVTACLVGGAHAQAWRLQSWGSYGANAQHTANSQLTASPIKAIMWSTPVDTDPQYSGTVLYAHYAAPLVTFQGNVMVTVKTGAAGNFQVEGHNGYTGGLQFVQTTDYVVPAHDWFPICGSALDGPLGMVTPGAGGTIYYRARTDMANSPVTQMSFFGMAGANGYTNNKSVYNSNVFICTPITVDNFGNIFFGFRTTGTTPAGLSSGIARISPTGVGTWVSAASVSGSASFNQPAMNCSPALSNDQKTLYIGVNSSSGGYGGALIGIDTTTLAAKYAVSLFDPRTNNPAYVDDDSSATPMVGPDGDVFYGVLESPLVNSRGWMMHYDSTLKTQKVTGAFGWDDTASIVPRSCVPSYTGKSSYLLLTKYNYYAGIGGGDGTNRVAILDPNTSFVKPSSGVPVMVEVETVLGPTPDPGAVNGGFPNAVHEWCINSAAIDARTRCAIINSEDGKCYRWDLISNTLSQSMVLSSGLGEAYTSTVIGKFGFSFAINNARLCAVGSPQ